MFRQAEGDKEAVMSFYLGDKEAVLPLSRISKEFGIVPGGADARMLGLIVEALEFVSVLRIGDPLPPEVLSGAASWKPKAQYKLIAEARLRMQLIAWLTPESERVEAAGRTLLLLAEDPVIRAQAQDAMARAAAEIGLASPRDVLARMQNLAEELSYLEHLRACFRDRLDQMTIKIGAFTPRVRAGTGMAETLSQVLKLLAAARQKVASRFEDLDAQTSEIIPALQNLDQHRDFIRAGRDYLYRSYRGFEPHLDRFDQFELNPESDLPGLLNPLYRFLAPRFMSYKEWLRQDRAAPRAFPRSMPW